MQPNNWARKDFIERLLLELFKHKKVDANKVMSFCEDILWFLEEENEIEIQDECETNQYPIGIKELFRGHAIKDWKGTDFYCKKYKKLNKILVKMRVLHCNEC